ncbi:hypothetical protein FSP39_018424 [Pinctada imbricata]|uniref:Uncharacterized protein n=1 Tax=Pinctada imbricata TaxID=66713 RepID=A0AA88Y239_PINIB|nr:hypothetical protein FSP39_018424 [Pinctada imbricata]
MGNTQAALDDEEIADLKESTPFTDNELKRVERRYLEIDKSDDGVAGITYDNMIQLSEFSGNPLAPLIIASNLEKDSQRVYGKEFAHIFGILHPKTPTSDKKEFFFEMFNIYGTGILKHDEVFRLYKTLYSNAISDDHILALTYRVLDSPKLAKKGEITKDEFMKLVPDHEIRQRLTLVL